MYALQRADEATVEISDQVNALIEAEKQDLLTKHYKPTLPGNIHEALCNLSDEQFELMGKAMDEQRWADLGVMVNLWTKAYHEADAWDVAESNVLREGI